MKLPFKPTWRAFLIAVSVAFVFGFVLETALFRGWPGMFSKSDLLAKGGMLVTEQFACLSRNGKYICGGAEFARQQILLLFVFVVLNPIAWTLGICTFLFVAWFEKKKK